MVTNSEKKRSKRLSVLPRSDEAERGKSMIFLVKTQRKGSNKCSKSMVIFSKIWWWESMIIDVIRVILIWVLGGFDLDFWWKSRDKKWTPSGSPLLYFFLLFFYFLLFYDLCRKNSKKNMGSYIPPPKKNNFLLKIDVSHVKTLGV